MSDALRIDLRNGGTKATVVRSEYVIDAILADAAAIHQKWRAPDLARAAEILSGLDISGWKIRASGDSIGVEVEGERRIAVYLDAGRIRTWDAESGTFTKVLLSSYQHISPVSGRPLEV